MSVINKHTWIKIKIRGKTPQVITMEMHLYTDNTKIKLKIKNPTQLSKECRLIDQRSHILGFVTFTNQIKELISSSTL